MGTPRILIYTVALNGYGFAYRKAINTQKEYAAAVGATYVEVKKPAVSDPAIAAWLKIPIMNRALNSNNWDWVCYIDADCAVSAKAPNFVEWIQAGVPMAQEVFMAEGRSGRLNSGVMFAKAGVRSSSFFTSVENSARESIPTEDRANLKYENGNVIYVDRLIQPAERISPVWNNTFDPALDDFVRHFTGPLRSEYKRSYVDSFVVRGRKRLSKRATAQPERRSADFVNRLQETTERAGRLFPQLGI